MSDSFTNHVSKIKHVAILSHIILCFVLDLNSFGTATPPTTNFPTSFPIENSCYEGEIRIITINSTTRTNSRNMETFTTFLNVPLVCVNRTLTYICSNGWDDVDARAVCRGGGFRKPFINMLKLGFRYS